ncbi:putative baseplate assembly protein [Actinokineospora auranticolor]|uniref:Putative phage baseplate assembly protein n=1 Tax=Actinokineospora auranticolor TaxID=155976 RepID=A0A2S6GTD8_9PSEU|nr:putative baseplate assembly protein [Actinokineospora auranticolor]PPK68456.1 putative phage baseplate assembly protein [Actinokineospora auranticolor]
MALPAPNLDDRRFQQLVDEAKRFVRQRSPEWTDHNVSDPGVTLIETFAHMVDQVVYRLNRVPERHYLAFLDLLGVTLFPPAAARAEVVFWLSAARRETVPLPAGTEVATQQTEDGEAVVFASVADLPIVPCELTRLVTASADGEHVDRGNDLAAGRDVPCFQARPAPGDVLLFGLTGAVPRCVVAVRLDSRVEGVGVDPRQPPLVWEAWTPDGWRECQAFEDTTGGLNRPGDVVLRVPAGHVESVAAGVRAGWLRCRVVEPVEGQPFYSESPTVRVAEVDTIGGWTDVEHAETVFDAHLGVSAGVPGQRFRLGRVPVLMDGPPVVVEVSSVDGWQEWSVVDHFGLSGPRDRHVTLNATTGDVEFPPGVRESDGSLRAYGEVPAKGSHIRVPRYRTGGGRSGNVARGAISVLRSSVPYVSSVENREAATGGVDGESVEEAKVRAPHQLRVQERAVTTEDYEHLARLAAPAAARVRCLAVGAGTARVLVVPHATPDTPGGPLRFEQLIPTDDMLAAIATHLDERRLIGTRVQVEPPFYQGVTVVARLHSTGGAEVEQAALAALHTYLDPIHGGETATGWPFGKPVQYGAIFAALQRVPGVDLVEAVRLFPADPITGRRGQATERVDLAPHALVFSHQHQVTVVEP